MDIFKDIVNQSPGVIKTVEMHTSGEPTRIVVSGYPTLDGETLLEKRRCAREKYDEIRKLLMLEPRGHDGMYGAILVKETELTREGKADIGVLFCHNEGYSTMCGHATIALGRFLVDTQDLTVFPRRRELKCSFSEESGGMMTEVRIHAPCGVVHVKVPTTHEGKSDELKPVGYLSVPSFVSKRQVDVRVPKERAWGRLRMSREDEDGDEEVYTIKVDVSYGGAFYTIVSAQSLGFTDGLRGKDYQLEEFKEASQTLESLLKDNKELFSHPTERDLEFSYGVMIVDKTLLSTSINGIPETKSETGLLFFAEGQIDRSPTGSCVSARVPLGLEEGWLGMREWWGYESFLTAKCEGNGFRGRAVERTAEGVIVEVEGYAWYTGSASFVIPDARRDELGRGFKLELPK